MMARSSHSKRETKKNSGLLASKFHSFSVMLKTWYPETWGKIHLEGTEKSTGC